jgi:hypothetical protein
MRLAALLLVAACVSGCGGTLVLQSRTDRVPAPVPAPPANHPPHGIVKQEAVAITATAAANRRVRHTSVRRVERQKNYWKVELRGVMRDGCEAKVRSKVDRWSGDILSLDVDIVRRHDHHHDHDDDHDRDHHYERDRDRDRRDRDRDDD